MPLDIVALLKTAQQAGLRLWADGDSLQVEGPSGPGVLALIEDLRRHKPEILALLSQPPTMPGTPEWHAREIARCVEKDGLCIFWSDLFGELVAFIRDDSQRDSVPAGIVAYTSQELRELFGHGQAGLPPRSLCLIHQAKKHGANITTYETYHKFKERGV